MNEAAAGASSPSVAEWLEELRGTDPTPDEMSPPPTSIVEATTIDELNAMLDAAASDATASVEQRGSVIDGASDPIRLNKGRLDHLDRCERSALAHARSGGVDADPAALLRGIALDRFVSHQLRAGRVRDPLHDLRDHLAVEQDAPSIALIDLLGEERSHELVAPLATVVAEAWSGIDPVWSPRTQSRATVVLSDGSVVCTGVLDVELGGAHTGRRGVVIEVKSGRPHVSHPAETYLYALLCTVRDRQAPAVVACWYPGSEPVALAVTAGVVEAAARRLDHGIRRWGELLAGDTPAERPGPWCSWCPDADTCSSVDPAVRVAAVSSGAVVVDGADRDRSVPGAPIERND